MLAVIDEFEILTYLLIFVRITVTLKVLTWGSSTNLPFLVVIIMSAAVSLGLLPAIDTNNYLLITTGTFFWSLTNEALTGLMLGLSSRLLFATLEYAGQFALSAIWGGTYNQAIKNNNFAFSSFFIVCCLVIFLLIKGHHALLTGFISTFHATAFRDSPAGLFSSLSNISHLVSSSFAFAFLAVVPLFIASTSIHLFYAIIYRVAQTSGYNFKLAAIASYMVQIVLIITLGFAIRTVIDYLSQTLKTLWNF